MENLFPTMDFTDSTVERGKQTFRLDSALLVDVVRAIRCVRQSSVHLVS
jgi:hypothetical protein